MVKISVIIPTLPENYERLNNCINSLLRYRDEAEIELIIIPNNWEGFEKPVNRGLTMATGDYLLICNDDVVATQYAWDRWMINGFNNDVGMVSGIGYEWKDLPSYWFVMMKKSVYDFVGGLDESFFVFCSDHDHAMRIKQAGFKIVHKGLCPGIQHYTSSTTRSKLFEEKIGREQELIEKNKQLFFKKWGFR
mgnify:CR=1 FL=1